MNKTLGKVKYGTLVDILRATSSGKRKMERFGTMNIWETRKTNEGTLEASYSLSYD